MLIGKCRYLLVLVIIGTLLVIGCPSTKEYVRFAEAGTTYAAALDNLLVVTQKIVIDSNSEQMLDDKNDRVNENRKDKKDRTRANAKRKPQSYEDQSRPDRELIKVIRDLRRHTHLLSEYFSLLYELGTSDSPQRAESAIGGLITSLNSTSTAIRGSGFVPQNVANASGGATSFIFKIAVRKALREELEARGPTISRELKLQEELFKALSLRVKESLEVITQSRERRLVIDPYESPEPISNRDEWITNRRTILTATTTIDQLDTASTAIRNLRRAFLDLGSNKMSAARFNSIISDFEAILTITEQLKA